MTFQAYLDTIQAKTGKSTDDFRKLAARQGLTTYREVMAWLKSDFGLGHGHANAMAQLLVNAEKVRATPDDALAAHFKGDKAAWRKPFDALAAKVGRFGPDVKFGPTRSYINLLRGGKKIGIVQISASSSKASLRLGGSKLPAPGTPWSPIGFASPTPSRSTRNWSAGSSKLMPLPSDPGSRNRYSAGRVLLLPV
jgi:hypothetical protein